MTGNAVAVGKKLGVAPVLARRTPAAGRNGKRLLTGEQKNLNEVIGKAGPIGGVSQPGRSAVEALLKARRAAKKKPGVSNVRYGGRLQGDVNKATPDTGGLGTLVPAIRGQARNSLVPQTSVTTSGAQKGSKLASFGGTKPSTAGLSGVAGSTSGGSAGSGSGSTGGGAAGGVGKLASLGVLEGGLKGLKSGLGGWKDPAKAIGMGRAPKAAHAVGHTAGQGLGIAVANPAATAVGAGAGGLAVYGSRKAVGKRRFDPEDERRHRQGALSATAAIGGAEVTRRGVREVQADTRNSRQVGQQARGLYPVRPPQHDSGLGWPKAKSEEEKAQRALGRQQAYERESELFARHQKAVSRIRNPKALKGAVVTGRSGGKVGAGLALMGAGATLYSRRREARYD